MRLLHWLDERADLFVLGASIAGLMFIVWALTAGGFFLT